MRPAAFTFRATVVATVLLAHGTSNARGCVSIGPAHIQFPVPPAGSGLQATGRVRALAVDPADGTHWVIGAQNGGLWQTRDGGTTWSPRADEHPLQIRAVAFAPGNPKIVYASTLNR